MTTVYKGAPTSKKTVPRAPDVVATAKARLNYVRMQIDSYSGEIDRFRRGSLFTRKAAELFSGTWSTLTALDKNLAALKRQIRVLRDDLKEVHKFPQNRETLTQNLAILEQNLSRIKKSYSVYQERQQIGAKAGMFVIPMLAPLVALGGAKIITGAAIASKIFVPFSVGAHAGIVGLVEGTKFQKIDSTKNIRETELKKIVRAGKKIMDGYTKADWGKFMLRVERYKARGNDFYDLKIQALDFYTKAVETIVKKQSSPIKRLAVAMHYLYKQMLFNYQAGPKEKRIGITNIWANPGRFFVGEGGNCVANTRFALSFVNHLKQRGLIPEDAVPIIFKYTNHRAPGVFYKGEYYDLMEGSKFKKPPTLIMKAEHFAQNYLREELKVNVQKRNFTFYDAPMVKYPGKAPGQGLQRSPYENELEFKSKKEAEGLEVVSDGTEDSGVIGGKGQGYYLISYERVRYLTMTEKGQIELQRLASEKNNKVERALLWKKSYWNQFKDDGVGVTYVDGSEKDYKRFVLVRVNDMPLAKLLMNTIPDIYGSEFYSKLQPIVNKNALETLKNIMGTDGFKVFLNDYTKSNPKHFVRISRAIDKFYSLKGWLRDRENQLFPFARLMLEKTKIEIIDIFQRIIKNPREFVSFSQRLSIEEFISFLKIVRKLLRKSLWSDNNLIANREQFIKSLGFANFRRIIDVRLMKKYSKKEAAKRGEKKVKSDVKLAFQKRYIMSADRYLMTIFHLDRLSSPTWTPQLSREVVSNPKLRSILIPRYYKNLKELFHNIYSLYFRMPKNTEIHMVGDRMMMRREYLEKHYQKWSSSLKSKDPYAYEVLNRK